MEHARIIELIRSTAEKNNVRLIVADMMAGVGPFAIPLSKVKHAHEPQRKKLKVDENTLKSSSSSVVVYANGRFLKILLDWIIISNCIFRLKPSILQIFEGEYGA